VEAVEAVEARPLAGDQFGIRQPEHHAIGRVPHQLSGRADDAGVARRAAEPQRRHDHEQ